MGLLDLFRKRERISVKSGLRWPSVRGKYDSAQTTNQNKNYWANSDSLSADQSQSPSVRRTLRNRARYEVANNSYARGIVLTLANDLVGTGPRLQLTTGDADENRFVERLFREWSLAVNLPEKLRTMRISRAQDGESFGVLSFNPKIRNPIILDLRLIESEQVATPVYNIDPDDYNDGITFDKWGNPVSYDVLVVHPGSLSLGFVENYERIDADSVIHYFRSDRPGQTRGVPDITPALPLFSQLRRFTLAVLGAAETAADFAGVLYTDAPANGESDDIEPFDPVELEARTLLTMPGGWKMGQVKSEQPATTYVEFKNAILNEIARCLNMPFNIAAGNSEGYNYASGRLDHQTYYKAINVDRNLMETEVLDRLLGAWFNEAILVEGLLPQSMRSTDFDLSHSWFWDGHEHVDPAKEANAQQTRLLNNTTTLAAEFAKQGINWEDALHQRAKEIDLMDELGISTGDVPNFSSDVGDED